MDDGGDSWREGGGEVVGFPVDQLSQSQFGRETNR